MAILWYTKEKQLSDFFFFNFLIVFKHQAQKRLSYIYYFKGKLKRNLTLTPLVILRQYFLLILIEYDLLTSNDNKMALSVMKSMFSFTLEIPSQTTYDSCQNCDKNVGAKDFLTWFPMISQCLQAANFLVTPCLTKLNIFCIFSTIFTTKVTCCSVKKLKSKKIT